MNKNIEDILKEALENHDAGYVSGAWESMSARLDGTSPTPFYKKWWVAAAFGTALVGSAAFFMMYETKPADKQLAAQTKEIKTSSNNTTVNGSVRSYASSKSEKPSNNPSQNKTTESTVLNSSVSPSNSNYSGSIAPNNDLPKGHPGILRGEVDKTPARPTQPDFVELSLPAGICANEDLTIGNPNTTRYITVTDINGKTIDLAPGKKITLTPKSQGTITVQSGNRTDVVSVHDNKSNLYIDVDPSLLYENGIPTLKFKVAGNSGNLVWNSNIKDSEMKGETYIVHPYKERSVEVIVSNINEAGCKVEEKQVVTIDEQYNLLAPTAFDPMSSDLRNKTFMPYALTQRSVMFEMIIIDPRTGAIVYSTSDSNEGWTGIDQRTGEYVKSGSVWPWRVLIKNPNTGEPREYSGTITKL